MTRRVAACHQPNFLPWLGWFDKLDRADVFVLLDAVQLPRRTYTTRTEVLLRGRRHRLSLPVEHTGSQALAIRDARLAAEARAFTKLAATLESAYGRLPHWAPWGPRIAEILRRPPEHLVTLNLALAAILAEGLGVDWSKARLQSEFDVQESKSALMAGLSRAAGATVYLSGGHPPEPVAHGAAGTAADYNDPSVYAAHGVELVYQSFRHPSWEQGHGGPFEAGLSALDALVRLGPNTLATLRAERGTYGT